jgi:hypothetical protein
MHATHHIPRVALEGVAEADFRCYPLRGDSLSMYASNFGRRRRVRWLRVHPDDASAAIADRLGTAPVRVGARLVQRGGLVGPRARFLTWLLSNPPLPDRLFQRVFSKFLDWDRPPLFKSFLRTTRAPTSSGSGASRPRAGEDELDPPIEDEVRIALSRPPPPSPSSPPP